MRVQAGRRHFVRNGIVAVAALILAGCQTHLKSAEAVVTPLTKQGRVLLTLPPPEQRIVVAVYDFPDMTGQYKESTNVQLLSRAVTQGGAPMLIEALQDAGNRHWFEVLDRSRLNDVLKERQIVTEMRRIYRDETQVSASVLPPMSHAAIIIEGGIVGYDSNTHTGGIGAKYLGIGADLKWQQDTVTVTLRAVSTYTSEVLASVTVQKTIGSVALQGNVFRYVTLDSILEGEAGVTSNEPRQIATRQAIEKAVTSLIVAGAELKIWDFADPIAGARYIAGFRAEKYGFSLASSGQVLEAPSTVNPTKVVETVPLAPKRRPPPPPAVSQAPTPPPPKPGELLQ